jgi:UDPglucose--hexose-1-phosphate uridylyltransferase
MVDVENDTHRRFNPLTREWVLVSPHRTKRPWQGQVEKIVEPNIPVYDEKCYLCPGNKRANEETNPNYEMTYCFSNDYSSLLPETQLGNQNINDLLVAKTVRGLCRVICFSPKHNSTLPVMSVDEIRHVVTTWVAQYAELSQLNYISYIQIFENKGASMGCSNPHPHCQVWASDFIPQEIEKEQISFLSFSNSKRGVEECCCLLCSLLNLELKSAERIVCVNDSFVVLVPFWATWPFETLLLSRRHFQSFLHLTVNEKDDLADIIRTLTIIYDNLFEVSFPYSMGFHPSPNDSQPHDEWHFHAHYYPPLLRSATVRKFMVGYEMLANVGRDTTAEQSACRLRSLPHIHYSKKG